MFYNVSRGSNKGGAGYFIPPIRISQRPLQDISREQMGAYLCIASNKIPPPVSKRITLIVECEFFYTNILLDI